MGIKSKQNMARDRREWRNGVESKGSKKECSFVEEQKEE
jgi:hypothetical protein